MPFTSPDQILRWINAYRQAPDPQRVPEAVAAMRDLGVFKDQDTAGVYVGFLAGVIGDNQLEAEALITRMFPLPPEDQVSLIKAIAYSGLPDWKEVLGRFAERMPARRVLIDRYLQDKLKGLDALPLDQGPAVLDALWGHYFATGRFDPVLRILDALAWSKDENNIERLTVAAMARWTLANNAARDVELLRLCQSELRHQPKEVVAPLREVIEAAETFELAKLRREALASIEDLKRKGPKRDRDIAWWANASGTVLALGCVAAAAAGQVQFGIPCIVGGPVAQAATRYVVPHFQSQPPN